MSEFTPGRCPLVATIASEKSRSTLLSNTMLMSALLLSLGCLSAKSVHAQSWDRQTQLELGAVITTGNTDDENIRFKGQFNAAREQWSYLFSTEGFRSSKNDELAAQRLYTIGSATYNFDPSDFLETRVAHEDDRFSGYDSQTDFTVSYGQELLRSRSNMTWKYTVGAGMRTSRESGPLGEDFSEAIIRLSTDYVWDLSDNARFIQSLGVDAGEQTTIARSETAVESDIMSNLSMKFGVKVKHQTEVPVMREKTDTEFAATLLLRF